SLTGFFVWLFRAEPAPLLRNRLYPDARASLDRSGTPIYGVSTATIRLPTRARVRPATGARVEQILKERDRLLQRTARTFGLSFTVVSLLCLALPGSVSTSTLLAALPLYVLLGFAQ